jgi:chromate transporter
MNWLGNPGFSALDWLDLFLHFLLLSMLSIGGAIAVAPEMHRYVVRERGWLSDIGFTDSVALAQAAPGPNILFVAVIGWNVAGLAGMAVTMLGILLPSTTLALAAARYGRQHAHRLGVRAFTAGMAPLTIGLMLATGWVLTDPSRGSPVALAIVLATVLAMLRTKVSPLWLIGAGALVGALGWI